MRHSVLLDTSFFVRLLNEADPLHNHAKGYFKFFLENDTILKVSTVSIAEYCVRGKIDELPIKNIQIIAFNFNHAQRTGEFAEILFKANKVAIEKLSPRAIIPNDSKLFAQADLDPSIEYFVTSDVRSKNTYAALKNQIVPSFKILDISISHNEFFGRLDL